MTYISSHKECPNCGGEHKGKPFCTYPNGYHCFSCGFSKNADRSFLIREIQPTVPEFPDSIWNPNAFSLQNLAWLLEYYVSDSEIRKFRIGETLDGALIFPYIVGNQVICYQTRLNSTPRRIQSYGAKVPALFSNQESRTLVIVEDFISAIRVAEQTDAVCLWGTKAPFLSLQEWIKKYDSIVVWLDNDNSKETNSGQIAAKKICETLERILYFRNRKRGFGGGDQKEIKNLATEMDPKCYSNNELKNILQLGVEYVLPAKQ